eukprot:6596425-Alexandrium_andersonii.AAC.1
MTEEPDSKKPQSPKEWPPWGCKIIALRKPVHREDKLSPVAAAGAFVGWDRHSVGGVRVAILGSSKAEPVVDIIASTT